MGPGVCPRLRSQLDRDNPAKWCPRRQMEKGFLGGNVDGGTEMTARLVCVQAGRRRGNKGRKYSSLIQGGLLHRGPY